MGESFVKMQMSVEQTALRYFMDNAHPKTGMVRDQAPNFPQEKTGTRLATTSSIAATGFGLAVVGNAAVRGMISVEEATAYAKKTIKFVSKHVDRKNGWFCHFVDWETGKRQNMCEFSNIDTALFLGGALYINQVCPDQETSDMIRQIYKEVDFSFFMTNGGEQPYKRVLSMGWGEEKGFDSQEWGGYSEQMLLLLLGLGHPTKPLPPEAWTAWSRAHHNLLAPDYLMGIGEALFTHQYSQCFIDFREFRDVYNVDYFENSRNVSVYHRHLMQNSTMVETLKAGFWGFSAGDAPNGKYEVYNALDRMSTVCIGSAVASAMFMPEEILRDIAKWKNGEHGDKIWGRYGFVDSVDLDRKWYGTKVFAITKGPEFMSMSNIRAETSVWKDFMKIPAIQRGMAVAMEAKVAGMPVQLDDDPVLLKELDKDLASALGSH